MPTLDGSISSKLRAMKVRRDKHLSAAEEIKREMDKIRNVFEKIDRPKRTNGSNGYTDMGNSRLASMVLEFAMAHEGKVAVADVMKLFRSHHVRCSPYVLLTRMVKANILSRTGRGLYEKA